MAQHKYALDAASCVLITSASRPSTHYQQKLFLVGKSDTISALAFLRLKNIMM